MCQTACPVLHQHRRPGEAAAQAGRTPGGDDGGLDGGRRPAWGAVTRAASAGADAWPARCPARSPGGDRGERRGPGGARRRPRAAVVGATCPAAARVDAGRRPESRAGAPCTYRRASNTMFGPAEGGPGVRRRTSSSCASGPGSRCWCPPEIESLCCGTPWSSKGIRGGYDRMRERVLPALLAATRDGELPVVTDASSCTEGLRRLASAERAAISGAASWTRCEFVAEHVLPELRRLRARAVACRVHPTCSSTRLRLNATAGHAWPPPSPTTCTCPTDWGCCAFAGDRGMLHPELTASATAPRGGRGRAAGRVRRVRVLQPHLRARDDPGRRQALPARAGATGSAGRPQPVTRASTSATQPFGPDPRRTYQRNH